MASGFVPTRKETRNSLERLAGDLLNEPFVAENKAKGIRPPDSAFKPKRSMAVAQSQNVWNNKLFTQTRESFGKERIRLSSAYNSQTHATSMISSNGKNPFEIDSGTKVILPEPAVELELQKSPIMSHEYNRPEKQIYSSQGVRKRNIFSAVKTGDKGESRHATS